MTGQSQDHLTPVAHQANGEADYRGNGRIRASGDGTLPKSEYLKILENMIDPEVAAFSERASRLLVFKEKGAHRLCIRMAERWPRQESVLGHYRVRPSFVKSLCFLDQEGNPLPFSTLTYPHEMVFETRVGQFELVFSDPETLFLQLPFGKLGVRFLVLAEKGETDRRGGHLHGLRNVAYTSNARINANKITPQGSGRHLVELMLESQKGDAFSLNITPRLGFNRQMVSESIIEEAAQRWIDWFERAPQVEKEYRPRYYYAWWIMRSNLISSRYYLTREAMVPSKIHYVGVWHWDACFHALAFRHVDVKLAEDQLRLVLDHQRPDGMIPDAIHDEGVVDSLTFPVEASVTKPPIIAWAALKIYESSGNADFLAEVYEPLARWNDWWFSCNDDDGDGIVQYNHPFSSGLDDSPLWDEGMPVESPELNTYLYVQMESLAKIATILGEHEEAAIWQKRAASLLERMIAHLFDAEKGVFWAVKMEDGNQHRQIDVLTPFSLYPLWTGALDPQIAERLVEHLTNPHEFWTPYPIPTVARGDPRYNPDQMWRGPVWININYIFVEALEKTGYHDLARELAEKTIDLLMRGHDIKEYYNPETGAEPPKAAPMYGWSAALFIDLLIRYHRG